MSLLWMCFFILTIVSLLLSWIASTIEKETLFQPTRDTEYPLENLNSKYQIGFEEHFLKTGNGKEIHLLFFPFQNPKVTVLFCHGNAGNITTPWRLDNVLAFLYEKMQVCLFDYQGYGKSTGSPSEKNCYADAQKAMEFLLNEKGIPQDQIVIFGRSLGTAVAVEIATRYAVKALILDSPFCSTLSVARIAFPFYFWLLARCFLRDKFCSLRKINNITMPVLMIHGSKDEDIPLRNAKDLYDAANEPKSFLEIPEGKHGDGFIVAEEAYWKAIREFLGKIS